MSDPLELRVRTFRTFVEQIGSNSPQIGVLVVLSVGTQSKSL